jgi:uncharacterized protein YbjT (DUF2867 family)
MKNKFEKSGKKTAVVIGATGLIGGHLMNMLCEDGHFGSVRALLRRPVKFNNDKIQSIILNFDDQKALEDAISGSDVIFCSVGTTNRKVRGDKKAYRKVDFDIPVNAAKLCADNGCSHFILVSSVGADSKSRNFYLKLKAEVEDSLSAIGISAISVFRPSMLLGKREESRFFERLAQYIMVPFRFFIPSRYKPVEASDVARAMLRVAKNEQKGCRIFHYIEIMELSRIGV